MIDFQKISEDLNALTRLLEQDLEDKMAELKETLEEKVAKGAAQYQQDHAKAQAANARQVGGQHYQQPIQVWDFVVQNNIPYLEGNAIKYIARHKAKGGVEDLKKAKHYIDKIIEMQHTGGPLNSDICDARVYDSIKMKWPQNVPQATPVADKEAVGSYGHPTRIPEEWLGMGSGAPIMPPSFKGNSYIDNSRRVKVLHRQRVIADLHREQKLDDETVNFLMDALSKWEF